MSKERGEKRGSGIKSHPLPTPLSLSLSRHRVTYIGLTKGPDLICDLRNGGERRKKRRLCTRLMYVYVGLCVQRRVKDENPLSRLTYPGPIFYNVDEPSSSTLVADVFWFMSNIITYETTIRAYFKDVLNTCILMLKH